MSALYVDEVKKTGFFFSLTKMDSRSFNKHETKVLFKLTHILLYWY